MKILIFLHIFFSQFVLSNTTLERFDTEGYVSNILTGTDHNLNSNDYFDLNIESDDDNEQNDTFKSSNDFAYIAPSFNYHAAFSTKNTEQNTSLLSKSTLSTRQKLFLLYRQMKLYC